MTVINPAPPTGQSSRPEVAAALLVLERMGLSPADLLSVPRDRPGGPDVRRVRPGRVASGNGWHLR